MEEDLIKKLEKINVPEVEIPSHKSRLRAVLLEKHLAMREKRNWGGFNIFWKLAPLGLATILLTVAVLNNLFSPGYSLAEIEEVALRDPQVSGLVGENATIKDMEIVKDKAYILIQPKERNEEKKAVGKNKESSAAAPDAVMSEGKAEVFGGVLAEIDLRKKAVTRVESFNLPLRTASPAEEKKIKDISENDSRIKELIPTSAEIENIEIILQPELVKKGDSVSVGLKSENKTEALIRYKFDSSNLEARINLNDEKVEAVDISGQEATATFPGSER